MKNLLNTITFKSVAAFAMVLLVAFAVTSSFNPLNPSNDIGGKDRNIIKHTHAESNSIVDDIGGRNTTTTGNFSVEDIGGRTGRGTSSGGDFQITDIGGRSTNTSDAKSNSDTGGRNSTGTVGDYTFEDTDTGGRGNELGSGQYSEALADEYDSYAIGGRKDINTGNLTYDDIGGSKDNVIIRRIAEPFSSEIDGFRLSTGE